jgi:hypothetical protein
MAQEIKRVGETCTVVCVNNNKTVEAVVLDFEEKKRMTVILNKSIKLGMVWNGTKYEGRAAGMDFESVGPEFHTSLTGRIR